MEVDRKRKESGGPIHIPYLGGLNLPADPSWCGNNGIVWTEGGRGRRHRITPTPSAIHVGRKEPPTVPGESEAAGASKI